MNVWYYGIPGFFTNWGSDMVTMCFTNLRLMKNNTYCNGVKGIAGFYFVPCPGNTTCLGVSLGTSGDHCGLGIYCDESACPNPKELLNDIMSIYNEQVALLDRK